METAYLLSAAREGAGIGQRELSRRSGIPQSRISFIEGGAHDALVSTLDRLASGLDAQVAIIPSRLHSAQTVAAVVKNSLKCGDVGGARSAVFQLADDLASAPPALRAALVVSPAPRTGDRRYDAWIAGLVELRLRDVCIPVPAWVRDKDRTVPEEWMVSGIEELRGLTRSDTPEPLLRYGVLIDASDQVQSRHQGPRACTGTTWIPSSRVYP